MRSLTALLFAALLAGCAASHTASPDRADLALLYTQDQDARRGITTWDTAADARDAERRHEVLRLLDAGQIRTPADHYHAAMVLQHGSDSTSFRQAHVLATRAVEMGYDRARWLSAATLDRWLVSTGRSQRYGTQFAEHEGVWYVVPIDTLAVSDADRARLNVPTLDSLRAFLALRNGTATGSLAPPPERSPEAAPALEVVGGVAALGAAVVYPDAARQAGVQGRVTVQVEVQADGTLSSAVVIDGLGYGLDEEVLRVVRAARFVNRTGEPWEMRLRVPVAPR